MARLDVTSHGRLVAAALAGAWEGRPTSFKLSASELTEVTPLLVATGAAPLCWWSVRRSYLRDSPEAALLRQEYLFTTLQAALHERELGEVFSLLRSAGVEPILIKGWALARLYPEQGLRPYSDIDLCVRPDQLSTAERLLQQPENKKYCVDLKHDEVDKLQEQSWDELYKHSSLINLGNVYVRTLGLEDHLRLLCIHLLKHGVNLPMLLCDIGLILETLPAGFDWDRCLGKDQVRMDWVVCAIALAHHLLDARIEGTPVAGRAKHLPEWLVTNTLKRWAAAMTYRPSRQLLSYYLRRPKGVLSELRNRWPDPVEATVRVGGPFNEFPRLPFQIHYSFLSTAGFLVRLVKAAGRQQ